jgi:hypothetical protein
MTLIQNQVGYGNIDMLRIANENKTNPITAP